MSLVCDPGCKVVDLVSYFSYILFYCIYMVAAIFVQFHIIEYQ